MENKEDKIGREPKVGNLIAYTSYENSFLGIGRVIGFTKTGNPRVEVLNNSLDPIPTPYGKNLTRVKIVRTQFVIIE